MKYKVLMTTMGMDIGGAETHILELAKGLKDQGHEVIIVSNGGAFVKDIKAKGIKHYRVPLHNKKPWNVVKSYGQLKKIMLKEKMDIVHAHARIPAFMCGLLQKKVPFKFVTTVHGAYKISFALKLISNWGQKALAVSPDLKEYLIQNYGYQPKDIRVTVNGIDTQIYKMTKSKECKDHKEHKGYRLLHVSRLEKDTSKALIAVFNGIQELLKVEPKLVIDVVGGGGEYVHLKQQADTINRKYKKTVINMVGPQTEVVPYIRECDGFFGISRSALEALSMEKPVVLAGDPGLMGLFKENIAQRAMNNNFTCRDEHPLEQEVLIKEISKMMNLKDDELKRLGNLGRETVISNYSIQRMINDALLTYKEVSRSKGTLEALIFGYIGFGNNGDEAIFNILKESLSKKYPGIKMTVLSHDPDSFKIEHSVNSVYGFSITSILKALKKSRLVIANGGSLLQDETSTRSLIYYLAIIAMAKIFRRKVVLFANGIGPIKGRANRLLAKWVINKIDLITLRDQGSKELLDEIGVTKPPTFVTADVVFTLEGCGKERACEILEIEGIPTDRPLIAVAIRTWKHEEKYCPVVAKVCDRLVEAGNNVIFVPMQKTKKIDDSVIAEDVRNMMKEKSYVLSGEYDAGELVGIYGCMQVCLGMRFHALVFSLLNNVPAVGMVYDMKVENYLKMFDMPWTKELHNVDEDFLYREVMNHLEKQDENRLKINKINSDVKLRAHENLAYLESYINKWFYKRGI